MSQFSGEEAVQRTGLATPASLFKTPPLMRILMMVPPHEGRTCTFMVFTFNLLDYGSDMYSLLVCQDQEASEHSS